MKLFQPNATYIAQVENGDNYLNCPTFLFNEALHGIARNQGHLAVLGFLLSIHYPQPHKTAQEAFDNFKNVVPSELRANNPNRYLDKPVEALPASVRATDARLNRSIEQAKSVWNWFLWSAGVKFDPEKHREANGLQQFVSK